MRTLVHHIIHYVTGITLVAFWGFAFLGWAYWMWLAIQIGNIGMFLFGLLGPCGLLAAVLGMWSLVFGMPEWLVTWVS